MTCFLRSIWNVSRQLLSKCLVSFGRFNDFYFRHPNNVCWYACAGIFKFKQNGTFERPDWRPDCWSMTNPKDLMTWWLYLTWPDLIQVRARGSDMSSAKTGLMAGAPCPQVKYSLPNDIISIAKCYFLFRFQLLAPSLKCWSVLTSLDVLTTICHVPLTKLFIIWQIFSIAMSWRDWQLYPFFCHPHLFYH